MNLWQCNFCNSIRQAPCKAACLPSDHYDPRDSRENATVHDAEVTSYE